MLFAHIERIIQWPEMPGLAGLVISMIYLYYWFELKIVFVLDSAFIEEGYITSHTRLLRVRIF